MVEPPVGCRGLGVDRVGSHVSGIGRARHHDPRGLEVGET